MFEISRYLYQAASEKCRERNLENKILVIHKTQMCSRSNASALQFDDGLQLAPTVPIFGNFRWFKVQFCEPILPIKFWKNMYQMSAIQPNDDLQLVPVVQIFGHFQ